MASITRSDGSRLSRMVDFSKRMRINVGLLLAFPYFLYGIFFALAFSDWEWKLLTTSAHRIFWGSIISLTYLPFIFVANDYFDAPYDALDPKKRERNYFCNHTMRESLPLLFLVIVLPIACSLVSSWFLGLEVFIISLLVFLMGFFYSAPPLRLKEAPLADFISHGIYLASYFFFIGATAIMAVGDLLNQPLFLILLFFTWVDGAWIHYKAQLRDFDIDSEGSQRTTTTCLGKPRSLLLLKGMLIAMLLCLPAYLYFNSTFKPAIFPAFFQIASFVSFSLVAVYFWQVRGGEGNFGIIASRSSLYRIRFVYPFAVISVLLINPVQLLETIF
ncbi:MAG: UbiA family prenyltransferase [Candidatus Hodarchaeales archaeon]